MFSDYMNKITGMYLHTSYLKAPKYPKNTQHNNTFNNPTDAPSAYKMNAILHLLQLLLSPTTNLQHNHIILQDIIILKDKLQSMEIARK